MPGKFGYCNDKNIRSGGEANGGTLRMKRNGCRKLRGTEVEGKVRYWNRMSAKSCWEICPHLPFVPHSQVFTSFLLTTSNYVTNFSNHLHGVGWGGLLTSFLLTTSKYFTNFSNHLHGVGWGKTTCNYIVIFAFKLQLRYGMTLYMTDLRFSMCRLQPLRIPQWLWRHGVLIEVAMAAMAGWFICMSLDH